MTASRTVSTLSRLGLHSSCWQQGVFRMSLEALSPTLMQYLDLGTQTCGLNGGDPNVLVIYLYLSRHITRPFIMSHNIIVQKSVLGSTGQAFVYTALMRVTLWPLTDEWIKLRL